MNALPARPPQGQPPTFEDLTCRSVRRGGGGRDLSDNINNFGHITLDNGLHAVNPQHDLGEFERLPLEILQDVLARTNLRALTDFRRVNQRAMQVVDSIPKYQAILEHGRVTLQGVLAIQAGQHVSCNEIYAALTTEACRFCEDMGAYIYLPTATRVCIVCLILRPEFAPRTSTEMKRFGLDKGMTKSVPQFKTLPGSYTTVARPQKTRSTLFDSGAAFRVAQMHWDSESQAGERVPQVCAQELEAFTSEMSQSLPEQDTPVPISFMNSTPSRNQDQNRAAKKLYPRRFMAVVRVPWLDVSTSTAVLGVFCYGCQDRRYVARVRRSSFPGRLFTRERFEKHLEEAGPIVQGEHVPP